MFIGLFLITYSLSTVYYNLSIYYQIINFLNTKNNIYYIILVWLLIVTNRIKITQTEFKIWGLFYVIIYNNINLFSKMELGLQSFFSSNNELNFNLLNGVMLIHPIILYVSYSHIFYLLFFIINKININNKLFKLQVKTKFSFLVNLLLFSISLGCWWAEQELAWGGWWSWDFVELLALNLFMCILMFIHLPIKLTSFWLKKYIEVLFFTSIISILCVRFNIINSVHNFVNIQSQNQYYVYILGGLLCFAFLFKKKINFFFYSIPVILFSFIVCIFNVILFWDVIINNIISFNYSLQFNVKSLYLYTLLITLTLFFVIGKKLTFCLLLGLCAIVFNLSYLDVLLLSIGIILCSALYKSKSVFNLHLCLILFIYLSIHQYYIFDNELLEMYYNNLHTLKLNYISNISYHISTKPELNICNTSNILLNPFLFSFDSDTFFKNIFEKVVIIKNFLYLNEFYNYNFQLLFQSNGWFMYLIIFSINLTFYKIYRSFYFFIY